METKDAQLIASAYKVMANASMGIIHKLEVAASTMVKDERLDQRPELLERAITHFQKAVKCGYIDTFEMPLEGALL